MRPLRIGCIYREQTLHSDVRPNPTGSPVKQLVRSDRILEKWETNPKNYNTVVLGDLNVNMLKWDNANGLQKDLIERL